MGRPPQKVTESTIGCVAPGRTAPSGRVIRSVGQGIIPAVVPANADMAVKPRANRRGSPARRVAIAGIGVSCGIALSVLVPQPTELGIVSHSKALLSSMSRSMQETEEPQRDIFIRSRSQERIAQAQREDAASLSHTSRVSPKYTTGLEPTQRVRLAHYQLESSRTSAPTKQSHEGWGGHAARPLVGRVLSVIKKHAPQHKNPTQLAQAIVRESVRQGVDPLFVAAVIKSESTFNTMARSDRGAQGLMQIMPATGAWLTQKHELPRGKLTDPGYNLRLGISYLRYLEKINDGNRVFALVAYNWGPGHVKSAAQGKRKIPKECMRYALKILDDYKQWSSGVI